MIDIEVQVFNQIAPVLRAEFPDIFVTGEYVNAPSRFPAVYISEMDNTVNRASRDTSNIENFADVMYQVDIYSNKNKGKKSECKAIAAIIDEQFTALGFTRSYLNPVPNMDDATIYRMTGRWIATVSKHHVVYRR